MVDTLHGSLSVLIILAASITGILMVVGALYITRQARAYKDKGRLGVRGESIGVILLGPFPIILRGRGDRITPLLLLIIVAAIISALMVMVLAASLL